MSPQLPLFIPRETLARSQRFLPEPTPWEDCMSLRDFNTPSSEDPSALHNDPLGNGAGLGSVHTTDPEASEPSRTPQIVGAVAVALMVGVAAVGLYAYSGPSKPAPVVADNNLPSPSSAAPIAPAPSEPAAQPPASTPDAASSSATPTTPSADASSPAPIQKSASSSTRRHIARSKNSDDAETERTVDQ
jgi:hypothetical protein